MVDVAYQRDPAADPAKLVLAPYGLVYHKGSLYLMAFSPEHQMVRIYKLDRVVAVELQKQHDEPDPQFDLQRQNHSEKADATIIWESLISSHLQHKKIGNRSSPRIRNQGCTSTWIDLDHTRRSPRWGSKRCWWGAFPGVYTPGYSLPSLWD